MKKLFLALFAFSIVFCLFADENEPVNEVNPDDTLKVYYLNEVVISSSAKETNNLKNLPTAVSVLSPKQLTNSQIYSLPELSAFVPNFFIPSYGSKVSTPIYIRGIGARLGDQTVSLYVDNVPNFNSSAYDFEFLDIQRVEVLRGAQGTLYGRNAIGGIVNIYTLSPLTFQGTTFKMSGGNYGQFSVNASNYSKLSDNFGLSLGGYYKRDDGYFMNSHTGKKVDNFETAGGKLKLEWQASPAFNATLFGDYNYVDQGAFPYMHIDSTNVNFNEPSSYHRHLATSGLSLQYKGNGFNVNATTGYQFLKDDMRMDQDYTPNSVFAIRQQQKQHSLSQEITFKSDNESWYRWVVGAYGFYDHRTVDTPVDLKEDFVTDVLQKVFDENVNDKPGAPLTLKYANPQIALPGIYKKPSKGLAIFHQSTFLDLFNVDGLSLTAGIRFDYEHTAIDYFTESEGSQLDLKFSRPMPNLPPEMTFNGDTTMQGKFSKGYWEILPKVALKYQVAPNAFLYASASKGYKTGGYNEQAFSDLLQTAMQDAMMRDIKKQAPMAISMLEKLGIFPPATEGPQQTLEQQLSYEPEKSWTFEVGGRFELFDNRLSTSFALFSTQVDSIQITHLLAQGTAGRMVTNGGKSTSRGAELSIRYNPTPNFTLYTEYGFAKATFKDYIRKEYVKDEDNKQGGIKEVDYSGNYIPFAPQHTLSVGASYVYHFKNGAFLDRLTANVQYSGVGKIYWTEDNKTAPQPFYGLTNASLGIEKGAFGLEIWGKNIFDTQYNAFLINVKDLTADTPPQPYVQRGTPARFGATLRMTLNR